MWIYALLCIFGSVPLKAMGFAIGTAVLLVCRRTLVAGVTGSPRRIVTAATAGRSDPVPPAGE